MYLKNCWYVAAYERELNNNAPVGRTILGDPIVLFRDSKGNPVALEDRCCHRNLPLSMGKVKGDKIQCGYHGLEFDRVGSCVSVPGQTKIPPNASIKSFPIIEKYGFFWIWMGNPFIADAELIPNWWWVDDPAWGYNPGAFLHIKCNYQLINDNLLDLSHLGYVHAQTIGNSAIVDFPIRTEKLDNKIRMSRWIQDRSPPPLYAAGMGSRENVDRWQIVETTLPCYSVVYAGCGPVGSGKFGGPDEYREGIRLRALNVPTPETEHSTFYFYAHVWDFRVGDKKWEKKMYEDFLQTFMEDFEILEAQQRSIDRDRKRQFIDLNVDAPGIALRRMLQEKILTER